jgi:hypothetical protein
VVNLVAFYYLSASEILFKKKGDLWWEGPYTRGTTVYASIPIGCEEIENKIKDGRPFWEMIRENDETEKLTIKENKKGKYFGLERDPPCLTILNAQMSDRGQDIIVKSWYSSILKCNCSMLPQL